MVRVWDPTRSDPTVYFIRKIQDIFNQKNATLPIPEQVAAIKKLLSMDYYQILRDKYIEKKNDFPEIVIKNCRDTHHFFKTSLNTRHFKGFYKPDKNEITICGNRINNLLELKENLDRELIFAFDDKILERRGDDKFVKTVIRGCRGMVENYEWGIDMKLEMTRMCAKNIFKVFVLFLLCFCQKQCLKDKLIL